MYGCRLEAKRGVNRPDKQAAVVSDGIILAMPIVEDGTIHPQADGWHAAGWPGTGTEFPVGVVGEPYVHRLFSERLFELCRTWSSNAMRGYQVCDFCDSGGSRPPEAFRHGRIARLGNAEVRVFDIRGEAGPPRPSSTTMSLTMAIEHPMVSSTSFWPGGSWPRMAGRPRCPGTIQMSGGLLMSMPNSMTRSSRKQPAS